MKSLKLNLLLRSLFFVFFIMLIISGCKKSDKSFVTSNEFNIENAKEWYYGTFKKSAEWASSPLHGKKLPDWKHGIYKKVGGMEIIEFSLITSEKTVFITSSDELTAADKIRITKSSLTKIAFIQKSNKVIEVRQTDYIPDFKYLQKHNYDISNASILKTDNNFTGKLIIRNWKGDILARKLMREGKITGKQTLINKSEALQSSKQSATSNEPCIPLFDCTIVEICDVQTWPDGMEVWGNCELESRDCVPLDNCEDDNNVCVGLTTEQCLCELYQICDGDGGGDGGGGGGDNNGPCNMTEELANELLNSATIEELDNVSTEDGDIVFENDIYRKPHGKSWEVAKIIEFISYIPTFSLKFTVTVWKAQLNDPWKWESFAYSTILKTGGSELPCTKITPSATVSIALGDTEAVAQADCNFEYTIICQVNSSVFRPLNIQKTRTFYSND